MSRLPATPFAASAASGPRACALAALLGCSSAPALPTAALQVPSLGASSWRIAGQPDLGALGSPSQQPVDFAVWQAGDGSWQLWSCIRGTNEPGHGRLFYRWQGAAITSPSWTPMGVAMHADPSAGEAAGGLQAPYVLGSSFSGGASYRMFYGTWGDIGEQTSNDGKSFARVLHGGVVGIFGAGDGKRDPMVLASDGVDRLYFTANPGGTGADYLAIADGSGFSMPKQAASGGRAGKGGAAAECPFVIEHGGLYYLFRTSSEAAPSNYGAGTLTYVYASADPTDFGIDDDSHLVTSLPIAAPEIHTVDGIDYLAHLQPGDLNGIWVTAIAWR